MGACADLDIRGIGGYSFGGRLTLDEDREMIWHDILMRMH